MKNKRQLDAEISTLKDLKTIVGAYQEIAAGRMRKVKKSVLQNRDFLSGLSDIYERVLYTYKLSSALVKKNPNKKSKISLRTTNGKTAAVLITANTGLYGGIIHKNFDLFLKNVTGNNHDIVIIGRIGKQMYENSPKSRKFTYFELSDSAINSDEFTEIMKYLLEYANVVVYHGLYVTILEQQSVATFVTGHEIGSETKANMQELNCLIEPTIEDVLSYFENQILSTLFEQTVHESNLSKFASRMVSLDIAGDNISNSLKKVNFMRLKEQHQRHNFEQMDRISGINLWKQ
jgi:ATP synthase F1 gamma subunit